MQFSAKILWTPPQKTLYYLDDFTSEEFGPSPSNPLQVNFRALICDFQCNPDQSQYVRTTDTAVKDGKKYMTGADYYITESYANKVSSKPRSNSTYFHSFKKYYLRFTKTHLTGVQFC